MQRGYDPRSRENPCVSRKSKRLSISGKNSANRTSIQLRNPKVEEAVQGVQMRSRLPVDDLGLESGAGRFHTSVETHVREQQADVRPHLGLRACAPSLMPLSFDE